ASGAWLHRSWPSPVSGARLVRSALVSMIVLLNGTKEISSPPSSAEQATKQSRAIAPHRFMARAYNAGRMVARLVGCCDRIGNFYLLNVRHFLYSDELGGVWEKRR